MNYWRKYTLQKKTKMLLPLLAVSLLVASLAGCAGAKLDESEVRAYADPVTEDILQAINNNDYARFSASFDEQMEQALPESAFRDLVNLIEARIGDYTSKEFIQADLRDSYTVVSYRAKFSDEPADVTVTVSFRTIDGRHLVGGFFLNSPKLQGR